MEDGPFKVSILSLNSLEIGSFEVGPVEVGFFEIRPFEVSFFEVRSYPNIFFLRLFHFSTDFLRSATCSGLAIQPPHPFRLLLIH